MTGDQLARLVDRHAASLVLAARQWCATPEDVVQDAFLKLAGLRTLPDNVPAWLYAVVRNGAKDAARAARRRSHHESVAARPTAGFQAAESASLDADAVATALEELPADLREIVIAHLWNGLSFADIAATVGGSTATAFRRYRAGLDLLRTKLRVPCPTST